MADEKSLSWNPAFFMYATEALTRVLEGTGVILSAVESLYALFEDPRGRELIDEHAELWSKHVFEERMPKMREVSGGLLGGEELTLEEITRRQKIRVSASLRGTMDSACLVFMHALVDDSIQKLCVASMYASPESWKKYVKKRTVSIEDMENADYEVHLQQQLFRYAAELERDSLIKKIDALLGVVDLKTQSLNLHTFRFDRDRLESIDSLRHDIVHKDGPRRIENVGRTILYLQQVVARLWLLTTETHKDALQDIREDEIFKMFESSAILTLKNDPDANLGPEQERP